MVNSNSFLIGWPNRTPGAAFSGGNWMPALPLTNLRSKYLYEVARSTNAANVSTQFNMDLGSTAILRCLSFSGSNFSKNARYRVQLGTTLGGNDVHDTMWNPAWQLSFDSELPMWEARSYWAGAVDKPKAYIGSPYSVIHILPDWFRARFVRVLIDDGANPDGYVQLGHVFIGSAFQPAKGADWGLKTGWVDKSLVRRPFTDRRERYRQARFATPFLSRAEAAMAFELQRMQGTTEEVLWIPYPWSRMESQRWGFVALLDDLGANERTNAVHHSMSWSATEI